jgi:hypothetical protein
MGGIKNAYKVLIERSEEGSSFEELSIDGGIILEFIINK